GARWAAIGPFETMDLAGLDVHAAVAANLWPELANEAEPSPSMARALESGALGVKSGRGLLGDYTPDAAAALVRRRERVLRGLRKLREGTREA
ncbi:MAG: 3-hydroxyacyl-CoA dehydrogenase family protein, partial [Gaiellaceae bacterium]